MEITINNLYNKEGECDNCRKATKLRGDKCQVCHNEAKKSFQEYCKKQTKFSPDINKITDKVYLGDFDGARAKDELKLYGITHIIICAENCYPAFPEEFTYMHLNLLDFDEENIYQYFKQVIEFIEKGEKVYIHCQLGVSRWPASLLHM